MRIPRSPDLLAYEHESVVDSVRRTARPPYAGRAVRTNWVSPGGVVWLFVCAWILILLSPYGMYVGFGKGSGRGTSHVLRERKLVSADLQRLTGGEPVRNARGQVLIDPAEVGLTILAVDERGTVELKYESAGIGDERRPVVVVVPHKDCQYQHVIGALDDLGAGKFGLHLAGAEIWLAKPL